MRSRFVLISVLVVVFVIGHTTAALSVDWTHRNPKPIVIKVGSSAGQDGPYMVGASIMGPIVHAMTQGKYVFEEYPNSQLGDERALVELVQTGALKITITSTGPLSAWNDKISIVDLPYLFNNAEHGRRVLDGPVGDEIMKEFESRGLIGLAWYENGIRHMTTKKAGVRKPEDLKGLKIRVMESPVMVESLNAMGANAVPMGWAEVITSLQQGLLDGQENPHLNILMSNTYEVTPIISETGHFYNPAVVIANLQWWKSLTDFERTAFKEAAMTSARYERMYFSHYSDWARDYMAKEHRAKIVYAKEIDIEAFRKACKPVYDKYLPKIPNGEAMLKQIRATK